MSKDSQSKNHTEFHADGSLYSQGGKINGKANGFWEWFRSNGKKMRTGYFENDKQVGEWTSYDKEGNVQSVNKFS